MQTWSQEEAIAFECARECLTHWVAILSSEIHQAPASSVELTMLTDERTRVVQERARLSVKDSARLAEIRKIFGDRIRAKQVK